MKTNKSNLFVYGTLLDEDVFAAVVGAPMSAFRLEPASLAGWRRTGLVGQTYPVLINNAGAVTDGIFVRDVSFEQMERVQFYECLDYAPRSVEVVTSAGPVPAMVFLSTDRVESDNQDWDLARWQQSEKPILLPVAQHVMPLLGIETLETIDAIWDEMEMRLRAQALDQRANNAA